MASFGLVWTVLSYLATATLAVALYELVRSWVKRKIRRHFERDLLRFLDSPDLYQQSFKFTNKLVIKQILQTDPEVDAKVREFARREKMSVYDVRRKVDGYLEEMVPTFNLLTYYKFGYAVARGFIRLLYDPVVDQERLRLLDGLPKDATPVYVMNHRSNSDYVLLAYMLAGRVSVSYAVGEWARVWPFEHLFRAFGSFLVRRGFKEDLYHKVLERYVQLQAKHGVAQALFPEGGLTTDGQLLPPKFGLLTWLSGVEADPEFHRRLVFIPVGVNYDWVLEDENLVRAAVVRARGEPKGTRKRRFQSGPKVFFKAILGGGMGRLFRRRHYFPGYASLSFGPPLVLRDWSVQRGVDLTTLPPEKRRPHFEAFGHEILKRIGVAIPATPVPLLSLAVLENPRPTYLWADLVDLVGKVRQDLEAKKVRVVVGQEFQGFRRALAEIEVARPDAGREVDDVARALVGREEDEAIVRLALEVLRRHGSLRRVRKGEYEVSPDRLNFLRYYANSLAHHWGRGFAIEDGAAPPPLAIEPAALPARG